MMGCECVSPPPEFHIPPPPDPSLIWHLLSDETADELIQIQQCDANQKTISHSEVSPVLSSLPNYLLYALVASGALISAALLVIIICIRIRRFNRKSRIKRKRKPEFSADIILGSGNWPYTTTIQGSSSVINNDLIYGSTESDFVKLNPIRVTPHSLRDHPHHSNNLSANLIRNSPKQSTAVFRLCGSSDGYCTVGRLYEEIPGNGVFNVELPKNSVTYTPRREPIYGISTIRRPPPTCRPPPPPSQDSPISLDSSGNSVEKEFDLIHTGSSPKRSTDDDKSRNSGNSGDNGRESGYGTAPNRSWNSPMIVHQQKRVSLRQSEDIIRRQTPLAVYAHRSNAHPMTYV